MLLYERVHMLEHGAEVRPAEAAQDHALHVGVKLVLIAYLGVLLHLCAALEDVYVHLCEEALGLLEDVPGLCDKALHQRTRDGLRGVQRDDEFAHELDLLVLQRLYERHFAVELHAVGVEDVVELVVVDLDVLAEDGEAAEEGGVIHLFAVHLPQRGDKIARILAVGGRGGVEVHLYALADVLPYALRLLRGERPLFAGLAVLSARHALAGVVAVVALFARGPAASGLLLVAIAVLGQGQLVAAAGGVAYVGLFAPGTLILGISA